MQYISSRKHGHNKRWLGLGTVIALCFASNWVQAAVTLNLKDAEIGAVVEMVSKETGKNFVVDPRVKGKVTVISSHAMEKEQLYQVFLSLLDVHGFSAIESGEIIKIVPSANAKHAGGGNTKSTAVGDAQVTRVVQIEHVSGPQLVPILRPLVPPQGHLAAHAQSNTLIVSSLASTIDRLMSIIKRIDQPSSGEIEVVPLQNASATEVVRVLDSLQQQDRKSDPQATKPVLVADERTNSILLGGDPSERLRLRALITHLDSPTENIGNTHVIYLKYAKAKDMVTVLTGVAESQAKEQGGKGNSKAPAVAAKSNFQIQADESTNALVITASPEMFRSLRSVIQKLDIRRAQVLIEAIIAEVNMDKTAELGVQWIFGSRGNDSAPVGVVNFGSGSSIMDVASAALSDSGALPNVQGSLFGVGRFSDSGLNFAMLVRALDGNGASNVLSTPSIVTLDNQEAEIVVGQTVPFLTGSFSSTGTGGGASANNPFQTIDRQDVGLTLKILPQINDGDSVKLDIEQTADSIAASAVNAADIITNTRSFKTSVLVDDGRMIVLGGLIKDELVESEQKVPLLGDIPLLGALFRHKSTTKLKTNFMVFLKPTILRDMDDSVRVTDQKYRNIRKRQQTQGEHGVALMPGETAPLLREHEPGLMQEGEGNDAALMPNDSTMESKQQKPLDQDDEPHVEDNFLDSGVFVDE